MGNKSWKSAKSGESRAYDGEMDVWSVVEGQKAQCGFVESSGYSECGKCGEAWQIEVVWTFGA